MFEKFGEFDSYEELNKAAEGQKAEGDVEALKALAEENGIDLEDVQDYLEGTISELTTKLTAAIGKLAAEEKDLQPSEIVTDWLEYIRSCVMDDEQMRIAVRRRGKSLIGCIGEMLKWSYKNKYKVDDRIVKASGINASGVEMGIPGMETAKKIIRQYYLGG